MGRRLSILSIAAVPTVVLAVLLLLPSAFGMPSRSSGTLQAAPIIAGQEFYVADAGWDLWQTPPLISGSKVVWSQRDEPWGTNSCSLILYDLSSGQREVLAHIPGGYNIWPYAISSTKVVWGTDDGHADYQVHAYDIATKQQQSLFQVNALEELATEGNRIIYSVAPNGGGTFDIWLYDLNTAQTKAICTAPGDQAQPHISGDMVVWSDNRNRSTTGVSEIYGYDLKLDTEKAILTGAGGQDLVGIDGSQVVYVDPTAYTLCVYDLVTQQSRVICAKQWNRWGGDVADGKALVEEESSEGYRSMYVHDLSGATEEQEICHDADVHGASLSADTIVWCDGRDEQGAIFAYSADYVEHAPPVTSFEGPVPDTSYRHDWDWSKLPFTLLFSASDPVPGSGLDYIEHQIDGHGWVRGTEGTIPAPADHSNDGPHTVRYRSADLLGNVEAEQTYAFALGIDTRKPATRASYATAYRGKTVYLKYKVLDTPPNGGTATVTIKLKNPARRVVKTLRPVVKPVNTALTWKFTVPRTWKRGTYKFYVSAYDKAGNKQANVASNKLVVK